MVDINFKSNKVSSSLKMEDSSVSVNKHQKGSTCNDIDIIAINEWMHRQEGVELFNSLRAIALLCNIVDGLDTLFFDIAKELPAKLELDNMSMDALMENFKDTNKEKLNPYDYIKSLKEIFEQSEHSKKFVEKFEDNFLLEKLSVLNKKFKIITQEEYKAILGAKSKEENTPLTSNNNNDELIKFANNIKFKRSVLIKKSDEAIY